MNLFVNLSKGQRQTVVVYGTSLTHLAEWPNALRAYFDRQFPGLVTVVNAAMSGQHSNWGLEQLQQRVLAHRPDMVLIEFAINDAATKFHITPEQSLANLDAMVTALREGNPPIDVVLQTMSTVWDWLEHPEGKRSASDRPHLPVYYELYRSYAREHDLPLIDHHQNWLRLQQEDEPKFRRWLPDGCHPTSEASLAVTWPAIETLLERARR